MIAHMTFIPYRGSFCFVLFFRFPFLSLYHGWLSRGVLFPIEPLE